MTDIARIGFVADTTDLERAEDRLDAIEPAAKRAETAAQKLERRIVQLEKGQAGFNREAGKTVGAVEKTTQAINKMDRASAGLGSTLKAGMGLFAGIAAIFATGFGIGSIVTTLADFEYEMSAVAAVSGATGDTLQRLRDTAKELGSTTEFSATQGAQGLKLLSQAGYSAEEAIATIPHVLNLATTEAMELGTATDYVASIMAGFGLQATDAARATDVLVYASNAANTGVGELAQGMKYVAPIARALGISIEETAAAMGILSNAGLKGEQAGTMLRGSLAALGNPSNTAADEIERLGLTIEKLNPQTNSIQTIIERLAASGLSAAGAFKIFGTEAAPAILALIAEKDELAKLNAEMNNVGGTAQRVADYMRDNLRGSLNNLSSAAEAVIISLGEAGLTAVLLGLFGAFTTVLLGVSAAIDVFGEFLRYIDFISPALAYLGDNMNTVIAVLGGLTAAIAVYYTPAAIAAIYQTGALALSTLAARGGFIGLASGIYTSVAALVTLRGALIATGLGAVAVLVGIVIQKVLDLSEELGGLGGVWTYIGLVTKAVLEKMSDNATWAGSQINIVWLNIAVAFERMISGIREKWAGLLSDMAGQARNLPLGGEYIAGIIDEVAASVNTSVDNSKTKIAEMEAEIVSSANAGAEALKRMAEPIDFGAIKTEVKTLQDDLKGLGGTPGTATPPALPEMPGASDTGGSGGKAEKIKEEASALEKLTEQYQKLAEPINQAEAAFKALDEAKKLGLVTDDQYTSNLKNIEDAFMSMGGSAQQWSAIMAGEIETVAEQLKDLGENSLKGVGSEIGELATGGSADFASLTKSMIKDLIALGWQLMVIKPLMASLGFANGGAFGGGGIDEMGPKARPFALGGAFTNSIVSRPTAFQFANGDGFGLGVMGEAGPEAVMPLKRGPDGSLGVQMHGAGGGLNRQPQGGGERDIRLYVEEAPGFASRVRAEAQGVAVETVKKAAPQIENGAMDRTRKSMRKSKESWGF